MILAFDSYYFEDKAKTVCIAFHTWTDAEPVAIFSELKSNIAPYEPGYFYKRELPCILSLLNTIELQNIACIVVDSFVFLDDAGKVGLGGHLYAALDKKIPIIGVAKSGFRSNQKNMKALLRGESKKPLFVSAIGIELEAAYASIASMHGAYRMPTLLQILDTATKA